jgi:hypothetical protein
VVASGGANAALQKFAEELRQLLGESRFRSFRALARELHYSHEIVSSAARGRTLPSLEVTVAIVAACGGNVEDWTRRWHAISRAGRVESAPHAVASPAWPEEPVADGADPEASGCNIDAVTMHSRRVSLAGRRHVIGELDLRYSPRCRTAWGRFRGFDGLDKLAMFRHRVDLVIGVVREVDHLELSYATEYAFDYSWGDMVTTGRGSYYAWVRVFFDGMLHASAETEKRALH